MRRSEVEVEASTVRGNGRTPPPHPTRRYHCACIIAKTVFLHSFTFTRESKRQVALKDKSRTGPHPYIVFDRVGNKCTSGLLSYHPGPRPMPQTLSYPSLSLFLENCLTECYHENSVCASSASSLEESITIAGSGRLTAIKASKHN